MPRNSEPSYDTDPRLPQATIVIAVLAIVLIAGVILIVRGLT